VPKIIEVELIK